MKKNIFGFNNNQFLIKEQIDSITKDVGVELNKLVQKNTKGFKLSTLQDILNNKYFEYENILKSNKVNIKDLNEFQSECLKLKTLMENEYKNKRNEICSEILSNEYDKIIYNNINKMKFDTLDDTELERQFDINYNIASVSFYNSINNWTFDNDNQMHLMVKEALDQLKEEQSSRLIEIKNERAQALKQLRLNEELYIIEQQKKKQKIEEISSNKKQNLEEQRKKALAGFMAEKKKEASATEVKGGSRRSTILDDIDEDEDTPKFVKQSKKRKSIEEDDEDDSKTAKAKRVAEERAKALKHFEEDKRKQEEKLKKTVKGKGKIEKTGDVLEEARAAAKLQMEERVKAATKNLKGKKK